MPGSDSLNLYIKYSKPMGSFKDSQTKRSISKSYGNFPIYSNGRQGHIKASFVHPLSIEPSGLGVPLL